MLKKNASISSVDMISGFSSEQRERLKSIRTEALNRASFEQLELQKALEEIKRLRETNAQLSVHNEYLTSEAQRHSERAEKYKQKYKETKEKLDFALQKSEMLGEKNKLLGKEVSKLKSTVNSVSHYDPSSPQNGSLRKNNLRQDLSNVFSSKLSFCQTQTKNYSQRNSAYRY